MKFSTFQAGFSRMVRWANASISVFEKKKPSIEHVGYSDALEFFKEAHRDLAPGGTIRMVTPNLLQFLCAF